MDTLTPQQPEQPIAEMPNEPNAEQTALPKWHAPTITRIDIKRTMALGGSNVDGITGTA